jgi:hypothetical protein
MDQAQTGHRYEEGYQAGRSACIRAGSSSPARDWIEANLQFDDAYAAGFEWALWDYDDANGLRTAPASTLGRRSTRAG